MLDATDRKIINGLQGGFPVSERPFADAAARLGLEEGDLVRRLHHLRETGVLSRFGPMFDAEAMGGAFCLCAMRVPEARFDAVADLVNRHPEVAHNYARSHELNMWFVLASDSPERIGVVTEEIERETGLDVYSFPKEHEFFIGLRVEA
ncbi:MAG: Lrp/AsnC family transcriptional regulator [Alphaproteobacteria bacterium]|nr:MAG: Lrp/AsnC family transcriptional regulator [Alphaproteobacteria bacterium]